MSNTGTGGTPLPLEHCRCNSLSHPNVHEGLPCQNLVNELDGLCEECHQRIDADTFSTSAVLGEAVLGHAILPSGSYGAGPYGKEPYGGRGFSGVSATGSAGSLAPQETVNLSGRGSMRGSASGRLHAEPGAVGSIKAHADITEDPDTLVAVGEVINVQDAFNATIVTGFWSSADVNWLIALQSAEATVSATIAMAEAQVRTPRVRGLPGDNLPDAFPLGEAEIESLRAVLVAIKIHIKLLSERAPDPLWLELIERVFRAGFALLGKLASWITKVGKDYVETFAHEHASSFGKSTGTAKGIAGWVGVASLAGFAVSGPSADLKTLADGIALLRIAITGH